MAEITPNYTGKNATWDRTIARTIAFVPRIFIGLKVNWTSESGHVGAVSNLLLLK